ncbi:hypothetical protein [Arcobacter sp.]|uniref:hypothetical protein n=1 Tax=Arcobacter sp. TaxID=1872629 RepID=UPI003D0A5426
MEKKSNHIEIYIVIIILIMGLIMFYIQSSKNWENLGNAFSLKNSSIVNSDPIKLQFRHPFQYDKYVPPKKPTFIQKKLEEDGEEKNNEKAVFFKQ